MRSECRVLKTEVIPFIKRDEAKREGISSNDGTVSVIPAPARRESRNPGFRQTGWDYW